MTGPWVALLAVVLIAAASAWVHGDALARTRAGRPVVAVVFGHTIADAGEWAVLSLVACVVFVPMYLIARAAT